MMVFLSVLFRLLHPVLFCLTHVELLIKTINAILSTPNNDIWISSDKGLALLSPLHIRTFDFGTDGSAYIQAVVPGSNGSHIVSNGRGVFTLVADQTAQKINTKTPIATATSDILAVASSLQYVWYGTIDGGLYRLPLQGYHPVRTATHSQSRSKPRSEYIPTLSRTARNPTIFYLYADSHARLWVCSELPMGVLCIDERAASPSKNINAKLYDSTHGLTAVIRCFSETVDGTLFCAGRNNNNGRYLFRYSESQKQFENVSVPMPEGMIRNGFEVNALFARSNEDVWLCSNQGLFHWTGHSVVKINIRYTSTGEVVNNFKSIVCDRAGLLWIGTSYGVMVYYPDGSYFFLNEFNGLPANETSLRAMVYDDRTDRIIIGTVDGLASVPAQSAVQQPTPRPFFMSLIAEGKKQSLDSLALAGVFSYQADAKNATLPVFPYHSSVQISVLSIALGKNAVHYQYRLLHEHDDSTWSEPQSEQSFSLLDLETGTYAIEIRAIQAGAYQWSEPIIFRFNIASAWYQRWWVWLFSIMTASASVWGIVKINVRRLEYRRAELQTLVNEKTHKLLETAHELQWQNEQLLELNNEKNEFLGIVSHDLKNPITVVKGIAEFMIEADHELDVDTRSELLTSIVQSSARMLSLVVNLLDINRLERGGFVATLTDFDVLPIVENLITLYHTPASKKDIYLELQEIIDPHVIVADPQATEQVLDNLISNAIKYSPRSRRVFVRIIGGESSVRIEVQDQGPGLSSEDIQKLFGKFARLTPLPTAGEHSTGLGLSIVKKMVEQMQGHVWCESSLGHGATFIVELPTSVPSQIH
jgi:signal transduction histidine kinase